MQKRSRSRSPKSSKKAKTSSSSRSRSPTPKPRKGYGSVARTRGAAVTGEMKYFDCEAYTALPITAPAGSWGTNQLMDPDKTINLGDFPVVDPNCLFAPIPSASLNGRIGRKVNIVSLQLKGHVRCTIDTFATITQGPTLIRLLLVLDKQTNSSVLDPGLVLNPASTFNSALHSFLNPNSFGRYELLKDIYIELDVATSINNAAAATISSSAQQKSFKFEHKFKTPLQVNFNVTNGGTVADIIDNSLHIIAGTNYTGFSPVLFYYSRICYTDA